MNITETQKAENYRAKEACKYLSIGESTLWLYVRQGKVKTVKLSPRVTIFKRSELDRFISCGEVA